MSDGSLVRVGDDATTLTLAGPEGWDQADGSHGTLVSFTDPGAAPGSFGPSLNVVVQLDDELTADPGALVAGHGLALTAELDDALLIDASPATVAERTGSRALVAYVVDGDDVTLEQWVVPLGGRSLVLSATCLTGDYPGLLLTFQDVVASVHVDA